MALSYQSHPGTPSKYNNAPLFDVTASHMPIITDPAIVPIYKRQLALYRKAHAPSILALDPHTNSLHLVLYPMLDKACTRPVSFEAFNNHHLTHQMPRFSCFCALLGRPPSCIKFIRCINGKQWHNWFLADCDSYDPHSQDGCGYFMPLGKADIGIFSTDYFSLEGSNAPMHYYPPHSAPLSLPPMIYYPFIVPYVPQPFDNPSAMRPAAAASSNSLSAWDSVQAEPQTPKALKRSSSELYVDAILQTSSNSATKPRTATPDVFTQSGNVCTTSKGTLFHQGPGGYLTGPLDSPAAGSGSPSKANKRSNTGSSRHVSPSRDSSAMFHQQQSRIAELKNIAILLKVLDPCSSGISKKDLSACIWTCDICNRNYAAWLQEEHTFVCIEKHTDIEVIDNTPTKVIDLTK